MKTVKGLGSRNWQLQNHHGDVKCNIGNIANNIVHLYMVPVEYLKYR